VSKEQKDFSPLLGHRPFIFINS